MKLPTVKYFLYLRKSTDDTKHQVLSLPAQKSELLTFAKRESLHIAADIEESKSAKEPGRVIFNEMLDRIERGEANGILCWDVDRLYRNPIDEGRVRWLLQRGIIASIRTPSRQYNPSDAGLLMAVEGGRATDHVLKWAINLKRTHDEKLRRGQWPGSKTAGFMFDHGTKNIMPDPKTAKIVRTVFEEFADGRLGLHSAGLRMQELGIATRSGTAFPKSQMHHLLTNRLYMGVMAWKGAVYEGKFTPLISADLFERVQKALKVKSKPRKFRQGHNFPFCGIFRCSCGAMISAQWAKGHGGLYRYYRCSRKANRPCTEPYVREEQVAAQCVEKLRPFGISSEEATEIRAVLEAKAQAGQEALKTAIQKTDEAIEPLDSQLRELTRLLLKGVIDEETYCQSKEEMVLEKTRLKQERQRLHRSRELSWFEPARRLVTTLESLGKNATATIFLKSQEASEKSERTT